MQNDATALEQDDILQALDALQSYLLEAGEDIAEVVVSRAADELARLRSRVAVLEKGLTFIAECITSNIKETDDAHALLVGSERYTGPAVDKIYNILTGIERIARKALENRND